MCTPGGPGRNETEAANPARARDDNGAARDRVAADIKQPVLHASALIDPHDGRQQGALDLRTGDLERGRACQSAAGRRDGDCAVGFFVADANVSGDLPICIGHSRLDANRSARVDGQGDWNTRNGVAVAVYRDHCCAHRLRARVVELLGRQ